MKNSTQHTLLFFFALAACNPNSIGRPCVNPNDDKPSGTQVSSPALECSSRLCLIQATTVDMASADGGNIACEGGRCTCTAECSSDDDCAAETKDYCKQGFVCAVAAEAGPFGCKKLCVCQADLVAGFNKCSESDPKVITPFACNPKVSFDETCLGTKETP